MEAGEGGGGAAVAGAESKFAMAVAKSRFERAHKQNHNQPLVAQLLDTAPLLG